MIGGRTPAPNETAKYVNMFEEAEDATYPAQKRAQRDRDYYDGKQLTPEEISALKERGQPPVVINRVRRKVDYLCGLEVQTRTDPKAYPRTPQHEQGAEAATDALRFVADNVDWDNIRSDIYEDMLVEGYGGCEVVHNVEGDRVEVAVNYYPWDRLFYDPYSRRADFSDARYKGAVIWMDAEEAIEQGAKEKDINWSLQDAAMSETYDDRPKYYIWADAKRKRVRIVLLHYKEKGDWHFCMFHKGGVIKKGRSPYVDEKGYSVCPLIMQSMYVDRDNNRYGVVRDMIDPQDEINKRRSKSLHLLTMRQVVMEDGAVESESEVRRELARPDGVVKKQPGMEFEILPQGDLAQGQVALYQDAKAELDMMGANAALAGDTGESASGRAVLARQQGGMVEITRNVTQLHELTKRVYEAMWNRIRQFWTDERWIRVTDDERNVRFVGFNRPVTVADELSQYPMEAVQEFAMQNGIGPNDPRLAEVVRVENPVEEMEVDISIEEVPDQVAMESEQFQAVMGLAPAMMQANPQTADVVLDLMVDLAPGLKSDHREKFKQRLEEVREMQQSGGGEAEQMQAMLAQMQMAQSEADITATLAKAEKDRASAFQTVAQTGMVA